MAATDSERTLQVLDVLLEEPAPRRRKRRKQAQRAEQIAEPDAQTPELTPPLAPPQASEDPENLPLQSL